MEGAEEVRLMCMFEAHDNGYESAKDPRATNPYTVRALRDEWKAGRYEGIQSKRNDMINRRGGEV